MKRPIGIAITAVWLGIFFVALAVLAIVFWQGAASVAALATVAGLSRLVVGLWRGEWGPYQFLRWLLVAGFVVNLILVFAPRDRRGSFYRGGKAAVNAVWALYMFRPGVRAYFAQSRASAA